MHCEDTQRQFDDYLDGNLPTARHDAITVHLQHCADCRHKFEQAQQLLLALHAMPVAPPQQGYAQRVTGFLHTSEKPAPRLPIPLWFTTGFATAILAVFAVWFMLSTPTTRLPGTTVSAITLQVVPHQVRKVDLVFNSPAHIQQATLRIELPAGVELDGYAQRRVLQWQTELKQGSNRLSLPLIAKGNVGGTLTASISHKGKIRTFKINIKTNGASSQRIPLNQTV
jgi:anti-sigma factor RsiW